MKIASWNVNSLKVRLPHLLDWLSSSSIDVIALQETKTVDELFPVEALKQAGYQLQFHGQKTYNGVAILSRLPLEHVEKTPDYFPDEQARLLAATIRGVRVVNVYVPNGAAVDSDKYTYKLTWLKALHRYLHEQIQGYEQVVVLGDFNIAPHDQDVYDPIAWQGQVLVSKPERVALQAILQLGFEDCFRLLCQESKVYSWWDYRMNAYARNQGLRIDLILATKALATALSSCVIDQSLRALERPSDHAPVVAEFK